MLFGARHRQFKCKFKNAVYADARHHRLLHHDFTLCTGVHTATDAGVLAFGVFSHDIHIDFARSTGCSVFTHHGGNDAGHQTRRTQVDVLVKFATEQQQRTPQRHMVWNFVGPTNRTKINRIVSADFLFPIIGHHLAVLLVIVPTGKVEMVKRQVNSEFASGSLHHPNAFGHDFFTDTVTRNHCNSFFRHGNFS